MELMLLSIFNCALIEHITQFWRYIISVLQYNNDDLNRLEDLFTYTCCILRFRYSHAIRYAHDKQHDITTCSTLVLRPIFSNRYNICLFICIHESCGEILQKVQHPDYTCILKRICIASQNRIYCIAMSLVPVFYLYNNLIGTANGIIPGIRMYPKTITNSHLNVLESYACCFISGSYSYVYTMERYESVRLFWGQHNFCIIYTRPINSQVFFHRHQW